MIDVGANPRATAFTTVRHGVTLGEPPSTYGLETDSMSCQDCMAAQPTMATGRRAHFRSPSGWQVRRLQLSSPTRRLFWMHSHFGLQEQDLLAAPLIVRDRAPSKRPAGSGDAARVSPGPEASLIFEELRKPGRWPLRMSGGATNMALSGTGHAGSNAPAAAPDLNGITTDARQRPNSGRSAGVRCRKGGEVRLRIINAAPSRFASITKQYQKARGRRRQPEHR